MSYIMQQNKSTQVYFIKKKVHFKKAFEKRQKLSLNLITCLVRGMCDKSKCNSQTK